MDFSRVRVHADEAAARLADNFGARALAVGEDIFFARQEYDPGSQEGAHLIAHELAHVAQRERSSAPSAPVSDVTDAAEQEASRAATAVVAGGDAAIRGAAPAVIAREEAGKNEYESPFGVLGELLKVPEDTGAADVLKGAGAPKGPFDALNPIASWFGMTGGLDKAMHADDLLGIASGASGAVGSGMGLTGWLTKTIAGNGELGGAIGGIGGLFSAGSSALDAVSDFGKGEYGKGALDVTKSAAGGLSGLAQLGGFELTGEIAEMGALDALAGGGAEGLAALGPAGLVLGSGLAGAALGTAGLGLANDYARRNDIFGDHRDSTEAAADAGIGARDYVKDSWLTSALGDWTADVAGGATSIGSSWGTAAYSGLHAAGSAVSDFFSDLF